RRADLGLARLLDRLVRGSNRVAQGGRRAGGDLSLYGLRGGALRIDPGLGPEFEDRREVVGAMDSVRADRAVVVDLDVAGGIGLLALGDRSVVGSLVALKAHLLVGPVAERLVRRVAAAAQEVGRGPLDGVPLGVAHRDAAGDAV